VKGNTAVFYQFSEAKVRRHLSFNGLLLLLQEGFNELLLGTSPPITNPLTKRAAKVLEVLDRRSIIPAEFPGMNIYSMTSHQPSQLSPLIITLLSSNNLMST
jgi:hypothetical protein